MRLARRASTQGTTEDSGHQAAPIEQRSHDARSADPSRRRMARAMSHGNAAAAAELEHGGSDGEGADTPDAVGALALARRGQRGTVPYRAELEAELGRPLDLLDAYFGDAAAQACALVGAEAFCVQNVLVFSEDSPGKDLVRHEVEHALQQGGDQSALEGTPSSLSTTAEGGSEEQQARAAEAGTEQGASTTDGPADQERAFGPHDKVGSPVMAQRPAPPSFGVHTPGLSFVNPVVQEGYDGSASVSVNDWDGWGASSFRRRWSVYDANDKQVYSTSYTWPMPTLTFSKDMISRGDAGGKEKPWSVWIEVTHTLVPFGGDDPSNFPYAYMEFQVHETWDSLMADPSATLSTQDGADSSQDSGGADSGGSPDPVATSGTQAASSVVDYGSVVAMNEAYLRKIYESAARGITETAKELVSSGSVPQADVTKWAVDARNGLKANIRSQGNPILKQVFEQRNLLKYGDKLGPSYQQLYAKLAKQGLSEAEINARIISSSGRSSAAFNRWSGALKWGGRILLAIDICLAGAKVYLAPEGQRSETALKEAFRIGGALVVGAAGAKAGAALGASIGALFGGAGAAPGAIIGGIIGGIGGAIFGGWLGESAIDQLYKLLPPDGVVFEGQLESGIHNGE